MIKWALRKAIDKFERDWNYDASYMRDIIDASPRAAWLFSRVTALGPCVDGDVTLELSEGGDAGKEPRSTRTRVDDVAHIAGVVVPVPLELVDRSAQYPFDHVAPPAS